MYQQDQNAIIDNYIFTTNSAVRFMPHIIKSWQEMLKNAKQKQLLPNIKNLEEDLKDAERRLGESLLQRENIQRTIRPNNLVHNKKWTVDKYTTERLREMQDEFGIPESAEAISYLSEWILRNKCGNKVVIAHNLACQPLKKSNTQLY